MFCKNCGTELQDGSKFCVNCGTNVENAAPNFSKEKPFDDQSVNEQTSKEFSDDSQPFSSQEESASGDSLSFNKKLLAILTGPLFLAFCICISASTLFGFFSLSFDVIKILITIFSWLVFVAAKKNQLDVVNLRRISGAFFAHYVINYVVVGLLFLLGILCFGLSGFVYDIVRGLDVDYSFRELAAILGSAIGIIFIVVAIILLLVNIFGTKKIHNFLQSLYQSGEANTNMLRDASTAKVWILIVGILSALGFFLGLSFQSFLSNGSLAAAYILLYIMIKKLTE